MQSAKYLSDDQSPISPIFLFFPYRLKIYVMVMIGDVDSNPIVIVSIPYCMIDSLLVDNVKKIVFI